MRELIYPQPAPWNARATAKSPDTKLGCLFVRPAALPTTKCPPMLGREEGHTRTKRAEGGRQSAAIGPSPHATPAAPLVLADMACMLVPSEASARWRLGPDYL